MSLFDIIGIDPEKLVQRLARWNIIVQVDLVSRLLDIFIVIGVVFFLCFSWKGLTHKSRRYIMRKIGSIYNKRFNSKQARWLYINTCYLEDPLVNFDNPNSVLKEKSKNLRQHFLHNVFKKDDAAVLHLVLGGSGMGKSSFMVALLRRYVMSSLWHRKYEIELIDLGRKECLTSIGAIENKAETILLLDALDENRDASQSFDTFITNLEEKVREFPIVVITCRTQFFPSAKKEPQQASIVGEGSYKDRLEYHKYYISFFSDQDVRLYLLKKYPLRPIRFFKARKAISLCKSLEHRPLLLSYIDDLLKEKNLHLKTELDLYECLIELWIKRERESLQGLGIDDVESRLLLFSRQLASKMYEDFNDKNDYYVTGQEADDILAQMNASATCLSFKSRSLIERDSDGCYKFAHRTFLEFFLAQKAFLEDDVPVAFVGLDMVQLFFVQMSRRHIGEQEKAQAIVLGKSETFATNKDQMDIKNLRAGLRLKCLLAFPEIKILSFGYRDLSEVLKYVDGTAVNYLRITEYKKGGLLNEVLDHPSIKYLWIDGGDCSKAFLKKAKQQGVSVMSNLSMVLYFERDSCPMDFMAAAALPLDGKSSSMVLNFMDLSDQYE